MGDLNFDLSQEKRFRRMAYSMGAIGAVATGVSAVAMSIVASPIAIAGAVAAGAVAGGIALPTLAVATFGVAYTGIKSVAATVRALMPSSIRKHRALRRKGTVVGHALGKGLKSLKEDGGMSLLLTAVVGASTSKAFFYTPVKNTLTKILPDKKENKTTKPAAQVETKSNNKASTPPAPANDTTGPKRTTSLAQKAKDAFSKVKASDKVQNVKKKVKSIPRPKR